MSIAYRKGYKYQLAEAYSVKTQLSLGVAVPVGKFVYLAQDGKLTLAAGYAWDGPSGPTIDTANFMRGSLVHDALYQILRSQRTDTRPWRNIADDELRRICLEDGMSRIRAWYVWWSVRLFASKAVSPSSRKKILRAGKVS